MEINHYCRKTASCVRIYERMVTPPSIFFMMTVTLSFSAMSSNEIIFLLLRNLSAAVPSTMTTTAIPSITVNITVWYLIKIETKMSIWNRTDSLSKVLVSLLLLEASKNNEIYGPDKKRNFRMIWNPLTVHNCSPLLIKKTIWTATSTLQNECINPCNLQPESDKPLHFRSVWLALLFMKEGETPFRF